MNYHIFHTSHCGSTLLSALLSKSLPVVTEPDWSHKIHEHNNIDEIYHNLKPGELIKYSSVYCYLAPHIQDKKIFLYRKLGAHLEKMCSKNEYLINNLEHANRIMGSNRHPKIKFVNYYDYMMNHAILWVERIFWIKDCNKTVWLETNHFLQNKQETVKAICEYLNIEYKKVEVNFNVKEFGLNHNNSPIVVENNHSSYNDKNDIITEYSYPTNIVLDKIHRMFPEIEEGILI